MEWFTYIVYGLFTTSLFYAVGVFILSAFVAFLTGRVFGQ